MSEIKVGDWVTLSAPARVVGRRDGYIRVQFRDEEELWMYGWALTKVAGPEPDWASVPRGRQVEVSDSKWGPWRPATYFGYAEGERSPRIAKIDHETYVGWRYCRLVGGEHE